MPAVVLPPVRNERATMRADLDRDEQPGFLGFGHCLDVGTQISSLAPFGTPAHAGKSGRGRSPRSWLLGAGEPVNECDPGSRWWGCALLLRARGSDSSHPVRFLRATASL